MDPVITTRNLFTVLGVQTRITRGSETPELFTSIWNQFESRRREIEVLSIQNHYFGVNFPTDKEDATEYLSGMMVPIDSPVPKGLQKRDVSGGRFAVFASALEAIGASYRHIFTEWLPHASDQFNPTVPVFEEYPEKESPCPVLVHIPLR